VAISAYSVFSGEIKSNIIENLDNSWLKIGSIIAMTVNLLFSINIILNPIYQSLEKLLKAPSSNLLLLFFCLVLNFKKKFFF
jgi:hypothetical protein